MTTAYDMKVAEVTKVIAAHVQFDNVDEAIEFRDSFKLPESASVPRQIRKMAEHFITWAERFKLAEYLDEHTAHRTQVSMLSEAIRLRAAEHVRRVELEELARLGDIDRRQMVIAV